jgi:hypothetical protein
MRTAGRRAGKVAALALLVALGCDSSAQATLGPKDRKMVKRIVAAELAGRAPGLVVGHAGSADTAARADRAEAADNADHAASADAATNAQHAASADQLSCSSPVAGTGEMVRVGSFCIDKYEASVWTRPDGGTQLTTEAQFDAACPDSGQPQGAADCEDFYARSVPAADPADEITWFQAQQALANSGRRLPQNAEWQEAVSGTPDSTDCVTDSFTIEPTGSLPTCVSRFGAYDMVGNLSEWVADWVPASTDCPTWGGFTDDRMCLAGASTAVHGPAALFRGGYNIDPVAGPFAVADLTPQSSETGLGFRGAR